MPRPPDRALSGVPAERQEAAQAFLAADWGKIDVALYKVCFALFGDGVDRDNDDKADDLVASAKAAVWKGIVTGKGRCWSPAKNPNLKRYMAWVVRSIHRHGLETPYERDRVHHDEGTEAVVVEPTGDPERVLRAGHRRRRGLSRVDETRERLGGDPVALGVFDELTSGRFRPAEFATAHGLSIEEVNEARQRAKYHWTAVIDADPDSFGPDLAVPATAVELTPDGEPEG